MVSVDPKLRIGFVLTPRFTLTAFSGFVDTLRLAADEDDHSRQLLCAWSVLGASDKPITSSSGVSVLPWEPMREPEQFDYIVTVGGLMHGGQQVPDEQQAFLRAAAVAGVPLVGLCTGSFVLARLGLLDGYLTCVSWFHREEFLMEFPELKVVSNRLYVVDGNRLTCAGGTSVVHLAARLVAQRIGGAIADQSLRIMIEEHLLSGNTPQPEQVITTTAQDPVVKRAMLMIEQNLSAPDELAVLAQSTGISPRQLQRRFVADVGISVKEYRSRVRLLRAKWLIEHTRLPLTDVGFECGFSDIAHLSRSFRSRFGVAPSTYRKTVKQH